MARNKKPESHEDEPAEIPDSLEDIVAEDQNMEDAANAEAVEQSDDPQGSLALAKIEIDQLKQDLAASYDKYLRTLADFDNFKKRAQKERSELLKYQGEPFIVDLIKVVDDFDLAMQFNGGEFKDTDPEKFKQGMELIYKGLCEVLKKWDIRQETAVGQTFDPVKHLAISKVNVEDQAPGTVVSELKKVFFYKDKLIRVGEVVVAAEQVPN